MVASAGACLLGLSAMYYLNKSTNTETGKNEELKEKIVLIGDIGGTNIRF